jgi:hypothetical protein
MPYQLLEHDPAKWKPVFRKDRAPPIAAIENRRLRRAAALR